MVRIAIILIAIVLAGCDRELNPPPPIELPGPTVDQGEVKIGQQISICSAGLSEGIRGEIFAELSRRRGNVGADFEEYVRGAIFSDESIDSSDKVKLFQAYLNCITQIESARGTKCQKVAESCKRERRARLKVCLENARNACIRECVFYHGFDRDRCVTELCKPVATNVASWTSKHCEYEQDEYLGCEAKFQSCMSRE